MRSIRAKLTGTLLVGLMVLIAACGGLLYFYIRHAFQEQFDAALESRALAFSATSENEQGTERLVNLESLPEEVQSAIRTRAAAAEIREVAMVEREEQVFYKIEVLQNNVESEFVVRADGSYWGSGADFEFGFASAQLEEFQPGSDSDYFQVWDEDEETVSKSTSLQHEELEFVPPRGDRPRFFNLRLPDGRNGRAIALKFRPSVKDTSPGGVQTRVAGEPLFLVLAHGRGEVDRGMGIVLSGLLLSAAVLLAGTGALLWWGVHRGLAPLRRVAGEAAEISADNLEHRFPVEEMPVELQPICARLNELLLRIDSAFRREKRFTSDAAHELRTPISELRALAEIGLRATRENEELVHYFSDALSIAVQMERLVNSLLALARSRAGSYTPELARFDLVRLLEDVWKPLAERAGGSALRIEFHCPAAVKVETDEKLLSSLLHNLLSNAVSYAPAEGWIAVEVTQATELVTLRISNSTDDLEVEDLEQMTQAFWRKDRSRAGTEHSGVGLTVVAEFSALLGISFAVDLPAAGVFRVNLGVPGVQEVP